MNPALKNILILLVLLTLAFVGYYVFVQSDSADNLTLNSNIVTEEIESTTKLFSERSETLNQISIDTSVFENKYFRSYKSVTLPIETQPTGNSNPFQQR